ncbi:MAG: 50S ribosomal protein L29 [Candidatus Falkowbacteria bacterium]|nr:50S ribosomal protein L29 [Candidatus Falkowbacteria bacterium]
MDSQELKTKNPAELQTLLSVDREKLRELRFKDSNKQLKNIREIRSVKKTIARILTYLKLASSKK